MNWTAILTTTAVATATAIGVDLHAYKRSLAENSQAKFDFALFGKRVAVTAALAFVTAVSGTSIGGEL